MPKLPGSNGAQKLGQRRVNSIPDSIRRSTGAQKSKKKAKIGDREKIRRIIVFCTFAIYWLLIFEGALRKWVLPNAQEWLFFVRDPFALAIYFLAIKYDMWPKWTRIFSSSAASTRPPPRRRR